MTINKNTNNIDNNNTTVNNDDTTQQTKCNHWKKIDEKLIQQTLQPNKIQVNSQNMK